MSTESLNRTSNEIKIPDTHLDVLSKDKIDQNRKKKRTCINALNQKLYAEQKKDKAKDEDKTKTIQELDREKLEKKFSKDDKEKLN